MATAINHNATVISNDMIFEILYCDQPTYLQILKYSHYGYKGYEMLVNVAEAKSKFSNLLAMVGVNEDEVVISKRDKPVAVLISYEKFLKMKK